MRWILLDLTLAFAALVTLVLAALTLWRRVRALGRQLAAASETLGTELADIEQLQATAPGGDGWQRSGRRTLGTVDLGEAR